MYGLRGNNITGDLIERGKFYTTKAHWRFMSIHLIDFVNDELVVLPDFGVQAL